MPKLEIADVTIKYRVVEVPESCPKCGASLVKKTDDDHSNLEEANYADTYYRGAIIDAREEGTHEFDVDSGYGPSTGETFIVVGYNCGKCHETLVAGEETRVEAS